MKEGRKYAHMGRIRKGEIRQTTMVRFPFRHDDQPAETHQPINLN